jgi:carbonic anhydrase
MEKLVNGFLKFRTEVFEGKKDLFTRLSTNQAPRALFITCSDSRVDPTLLTQTDPGELFILRNAGNLVPPYGSMPGGSTATIEFAMAVLQVPHIIVCGHTDCGAMKALAHPEEVEDLPAVRKWVEQAETTRRIMREHYAGLEGSDLLIKATQENVRSQLDNLRTHPSVALKLATGGGQSKRLVYSISTGDVWVYDFSSEKFVSLIDEAAQRSKAMR